MAKAGYIVAVVLLIWLGAPAAPSAPQTPPQSDRTVAFAGQVAALDGTPIAGATVNLGPTTTTTDAFGRFRIVKPAGTYAIGVEAVNFEPLNLTLRLDSDVDLRLQLNPTLMVMIRPQPDAFAPDPSTRILVHENVLDANPGRPGAPISVPGLPAETASGGIKAPQYFAPGVAGDHGEPIAQYIQVGDFLFQNNLSANAHGNGYSDPNILIPAVIGSVQTDAGPFNVRHGNHAIDLAVAFGFRERVEPFIQFTGDSRDFDLVAGWSPTDPSTRAWLVLESSFGNGFLQRPEARQQHKINAYRAFAIGQHEITLFGSGYYGFSRVPGLVPTGVRVPGDTVDSNQSDLTHTGLLVANDTWRPAPSQQAQFAAFFRTYSLRLQSNFGDGLIQQSERRTVAGGSGSYFYKPGEAFSLLAGVDLKRDAPRDLNLSKADAGGIFQPVTRNDVTLGFFAPYMAIDGELGRLVRYNLGIRRDEVDFDNRDKLRPGNSFQTLAGITTPKGTLTFLFPREYLPSIAFSYGEAFHTNDPRIGTGTDRGSPIARSRAYQLAATEVLGKTELRLTLAHVTNAQEMAKIDPDTGLQLNVGPSVNRSVTALVRREFSFGQVQASFSKADARDRDTGQPVPEAPRLIWDVLGATERLPLRLRGKFEFEYVGRKPLGDGFAAIPVREFRGSISRSLADGSIVAGLYFLIASGFTGQTLETLQLAGEPAPVERVVGVRLKSYASFSVTYHFRRKE